MSRSGTPSRRTLLRDGSLILLAAASSGGRADAVRAADAPLSSAATHSPSPSPKPTLEIGLLTDVHYADRPSAGSRCYRDALGKVVAAVAYFNERKLPLAVMLGDFIDAAPRASEEVAFLQTIEAAYAKFTGDRHYVLGNHCVWTLTKEQFRLHTASRATHYSFDANGLHFVVLDACYRFDGVPYGNKNNKWNESNIPPAQIEWLQHDLAANPRPTIVFVHQRLDVTGDYGIKSQADVPKVLQRAGTVRAVFQGHYHRNEYKEINGIQYVTLRAVIEDPGTANNAFAVLSIYPDGTLKVDGFGRQSTCAWNAVQVPTKPAPDTAPTTLPTTGAGV